MSKQKLHLSPKKLVMSVTAMTLVLALILPLLCLAPIGGGLKAYASAGILSSVSGKNALPDQYEAVNVPKGTYIMSEDDYDSNSPSTSGNGLAAFDFHIFADRFAGMAHTCGNIAVEHLGAEVLGKTGAPEFGSRPAHDTTSIKLSYIGDASGWSSSASSDVFVFGEQNTVAEKSGQVKLTSNGKTYMMGNGKKMLDTIYVDNEDVDGTPFIDIADELEEAEMYQRYLVWLAEQVQENSEYTMGSGNVATVNNETVRVLKYSDLLNWGFGFGFGWGGTTVDLSNYTEDTIIIDFDVVNTPASFWSPAYVSSEANSLINGMITIKGTAGKRIIFNVETTGLPNDSISFTNINMTADNITNSESSVEKDNNILWNFYKKDDNGVPQSTAGKLSFSGTWVGSVLAPDATVNCNAGLNGSIIATNVTTSAETHKSDYTGENIHRETTDGKTSLTITKEWHDNSATRPQFISIKLLQNNKVIKTVQISAADDEKKTDGSNDDGVWTYTFTDLELKDVKGSYYRYSVEEVVPAGYTGTVVNDTIINVSKAGPAPVVKYGSITVRKHDESGKQIPGAQLRLTSKTGANLSKVTATNADSFVATDNAVTWISTESPAVLSNLPYGDYIITELSAPAGYIAASGDKAVKLDKASTDAPAIVNKPIIVKLAKLDEGGSILTGAELKLTSAYNTDLSKLSVSGCSIISQQSDFITLRTTGTQITLSGIPEGYYTLSELTPPVGYDIAAPVTFYVSADGKFSVDGKEVRQVEMIDHLTPEVEPEINYYDISIDKTCAGASISGAKLQLISVAGTSLEGITVTGGTDVSKSRASITWTSSDEAAVQFSQLPEGMYTLTELEAPAGYKKAAQMTLNVTEGSTAFEMTDEIISMSISKKDFLSGVELAGAKLQLTAEGGIDLSGVVVNIDGYVADTDSVTWISNGSPALISKLPAGTYTLSEINPPSGYTTAEDITFTVDAYGNVSGSGVSGSVCTMYDHPSTIGIGKNYVVPADGSSGVLPGAVLELTSVEKIDLSNVTGSVSVEHPDANTIRWISSNEANTLRGLPDGTYILHESEAPTGFDVASDMKIVVSGGVISKVYEITSKNGETVETDITEKVSGNTINMVDKKQTFYSIRFSKVEQDNTSTFVKGATLGIFDKDALSYTADEAILIFESTGEEQSMMLADGEYVIVELAAPGDTDNPVVNADSTTSYVKYDKSNEKVFFTVDNGKLTVNKVDKSELAAAGHGNPADSGLALDEDCYFTLETTDIFKQYGEFPTDVSFTLPEGYSCSGFILYEDVPQADGTYKATQVVKHTDVPATKWHYIVAETAKAAGKVYDPDHVYYAVVTIIDDATGKPVTSDEVGMIRLNFAYPELELPDSFTESVAYEMGDKSNYFSPYFTLTQGNAKNIWPDKVTITFSGIDTPDTVVFKGYDLYIGPYKYSGDSGLNFKINNSDPSNEQIINNGDVLTVEIKDHSARTDGTTYLFGGHLYFGNNTEALTMTFTAHYGSGGDGGSSGGASGDAGSGDAGNTGSGSTGENITVEDLNNKYVGFVTTEGGQTAYIKFPNAKTPEEETNQCSVKLTKTDKDTGKGVTTGAASFLLYDSKMDLVADLVETGAGVYEYRAAASNPANTESNPLKTNPADGTLTVNGLNVGTYSFREIEAPTNYIIDEEMQEFVLNLSHLKDSPRPITFTNTRETGSFTIIKTDDSGRPVRNAGFKLYKVDPAQVYSSEPTGTAVTDADNKEVTFYTGNDGKVTITGLDLGYLYYAVETDVPAGYADSTDGKPQPQYPQTGENTYRYLVTNNGNSYPVAYGVFIGESSSVVGQTVVYSDTETNSDGSPKGTWTTIADTNGVAVPLSSDEGTAAVTNNAGKTTFIKTNGYDIGSDNCTFLAGAQFKLQLDNASSVPVLDMVTANVITTVNSEKVFTPVGLTHYHDTVKNDDGSDKTDNDGNKIYEEYLIWTSTDDAEGVTLLGLPDVGYTLTELSAPYGYESAASMPAVTVGGTHVIRNEQLFGSVKLVKSDSITGTRMADVDFILEASSDMGASWIEYGTYTTDANGQIFVDNLPYGSCFRFKETSTPQGYEENTEYTDVFVIEGSGDELDHSVFVSNTPKTGTLVLTKTDSTSGSIKLEGAKYQLYFSKDGNEFKLYTETEFTTDADGRITVDDLPWGYTYKFKETSTPAGYVPCTDFTDSAEITSGWLDASIAHTNTPLSGSLTLSGTKNISGRQMTDSDVYSFVLTKNGNEIESVQNSGSAITFSPITFSYDDIGTHIYTITEAEYSGSGITSDAYPCVVTVTVADNGGSELDVTYTVEKNGQAVSGISFTNNYSAKGTQATITATKTLSGRDLKDGEFSFVLLDSEGEVLQTKSNIGGAITFDAINYSAVGTHTYTVKELNNGLGGITYDTTEYEVTVEVTDAGSGQLAAEVKVDGDSEKAITFANSYSANGTQAIITATKTLSGRDLKDGEFSFVLLDSEGEVLQTKSNIGGAITFDAINYSAVGTHTYTVKELNNGLGGITYDTTEYEVTVEVTDAGSGQLAAEVKIDGDSEKAITFANSYSANGTQVLLTAKKTLTGRDLEVGEFSFQLLDSEGNVLQTKSNTIGGVIVFEILSYDEVGEHSYTVKEVIGTQNNIVYDTTEYAVTVNVTDNGTGDLAADVRINGSADTEIEFSNSFSGYELTLSKVSVSGDTELPGAQLRLEPVSSGDLSSVPTDENIRYENGAITWTSGQQPVTLSMIPNGIYTFTEITAPEGYVKAETIYVKIADGQISSVPASAYIDEETTPWQVISDGVVIMEDDYNSLVISKQDAVGSGELPGAQLAIEAVDEGIDLSGIELPEGVSCSDAGAIFWTSTDKEVTLKKLPNGVYTLTETTAPSGYEVDEVAYIKVSGSDIYSVKQTAYNGADTVWTLANANTVVMKDAYNTLILSKIAFGGKDELPGASLFLKPVDSSDILSGVDLTGTGAEFKDGAITWVSTDKPVTLKHIPNGVYSFTEVTAPNGYKQAETIFVKIDGGDVFHAVTASPEEWTKAGGDKVIMVDAPAQLTLSKRELGGGDELPGAVLNLKPLDESIDLSKVTAPEGVTLDNGIISWTSGQQAVTIGMIPDGEYLFTEITAPDGYAKAEDIYVKVSKGIVYSVTPAQYKSDGSTQWGEPVTDDTVIMIDAPLPKTGQFSFVKRSNIGKALAGATFALTDDAGYNKTAVSGVDGTVTFSAIPEGKYVLGETAAPKKYNKSAALVSVIVDSEGKISFLDAAGKTIDIAALEQLMTNSIIPDEDKKTLEVGSSVDLNKELTEELPDVKGTVVTWTSSNENIATVDQNGKVTIKAPGQVTITAKKDGIVVGTYVLGAASSGNNNNNNNSNVNNDKTNVPHTGEVKILAANGAIALAIAAYFVARTLIKRKVAAGR